MKRAFLFALGLLCLASDLTVAAAPPTGLKLSDGDRVILIGDTFIERDQKHGYLETLLTLRNPGKRIVFRNLGWSGDSVFGDARAGFGTRADGFKQLREHVLAIKPTVIIAGYGMADSFSGEKGYDAFVQGLSTLLDVFAETKARLVLLSPLGHEDLGKPLPDPSQHRRQLAAYSRAIQEAAKQRGALYVDLLNQDGLWNYSLSAHRTASPLTDNGIHLTAAGYWVVDNVIGSELLKAPVTPWLVAANTDGTLERAEGTKVARLPFSDGTVRFETKDDLLPLSPGPKGATSSDRSGTPARTLKVGGLKPGSYTLKIDGKPVMTADAQEWANATLTHGPEFDQVEQLRGVINEKNLLYFHRWRPQNETYLFGFRKHEQGNNAREIPLFDPLVEELEKAILSLSLPKTHVYELVRESEVGK